MQLNAQVAQLNTVHILDNPSVSPVCLRRFLYRGQLVKRDINRLVLAVYGLQIDRLPLIHVVHGCPAGKQSGGIIQGNDPFPDSFGR